MLAGVDDFPWVNAFFDNFCVVVDVLEEEVQRGDALGETALDGFPFGGGDDAWQEVVRPDTLSSLVIPIDCKGNALIQEGRICRLLPLVECLGRHLQQTMIQLLVMRARLAIHIQHLVERRIKGIIRERGRQRWLSLASGIRYNHGQCSYYYSADDVDVEAFS